MLFTAIKQVETLAEWLDERIIAVRYQILLALPYVVAIVAMMGFRIRSEQPGNLGEPYHRE